MEMNDEKQSRTPPFTVVSFTVVPFTAFRSLIPEREEPMRNITVTIPDDVYTRARVWAAQRDISVSAVVKYLLETLPGSQRAGKAFPVSQLKQDGSIPAANC
jgi:hypothetical protein